MEASTSGGSQGSSWVLQGPELPALLWMQPHHRSAHIFRSVHMYDKELQVRRSDRIIWDLVGDVDYCPNIVREQIDRLGFGLFSRIGKVIYDHHLIKALVERWRPETQTFHFTVGEATITLQDVEVLLGLRVDGDPVTGPDGLPQDPSEFCRRLFGFIPELKKSKVSLSSLSDHILTFNESVPATQLEALQRARCFVAYLLVGCLFCDKRSTHVDLFLLTQLENDHVCGTLSWGSALLAHTYRRLSAAAQFEARDIDACGLLIQTWAWERIARIRPDFRRGEVAPIVGLPLAARWSRRLRKTQVASHNLVALRDQLSWLGPNDFEWMPYNERFQTLPNGCRAGHNIWASVTYLHFYHIVEAHQPNRVSRQFGLVQSIPSDPLLDRETLNRLHQMKRSWKSKNWAEKHAAYLEHWNMRQQYLIHGTPVGYLTVDDDYFEWYNRRTVQFVEDPGHRHRRSGYRGHTSVVRSMLGTFGRIIRRNLHRNDDDTRWTAEQITETCLATDTQFNDPTIGSSQGYTQVDPSQGYDLPHARVPGERRRGQRAACEAPPQAEAPPPPPAEAFPLSQEGIHTQTGGGATSQGLFTGISFDFFGSASGRSDDQSQNPIYSDYTASRHVAALLDDPQCLSQPVERTFLEIGRRHSTSSAYPVVDLSSQFQTSIIDDTNRVGFGANTGSPIGLGFDLYAGSFTQFGSSSHGAEEGQNPNVDIPRHGYNLRDVINPPTYPGSCSDHRYMGRGHQHR